MWTAGFPEPLTFSLRAARLLRARARRLRRRPRQPDARLRDARHRAGRAARWSPPSTTRSPSTAASTSPPRRRWRKRLTAAPLVRLPADAGPGRPAGSAPMLHRLGDLARATSSPTSASTRRGSQVDPARRRRRVPAADRAAGARPDRGDGQRRRPDEGHRHPARGVRQAAHRARRRAAAGHAGPSPAGRTEQLDRPARHRRRRRASCTASPTPSWSTLIGLGRGRLRAVALRGLLAADRRGDGLRHPAGRPAAGAIPEVVGPDGAVRRPGHPRRRRRARARAGRAARRPGAAGADGRAPAGERVLARVQLARGGRGDRRGVPATRSTTTTRRDADADR